MVSSEWQKPFATRYFAIRPYPVFLNPAEIPLIVN